MQYPTNIAGTGIGLRRQLVHDLQNQLPKSIDFLETAPENWMAHGGKFKTQFTNLREQYPIICHGLSLSIGSPAPLDEKFVLDLKKFLDQYAIPIYSEHLSYCSDQGHLYDLLPIPFTEEAVEYVVARIKRVQEILERTIALENVSYYCAPGQQMSEIDFINSVMQKSGCNLLLDINNIYVNSINHKYDPIEFLNNLTPNEIAYIHIAGHYQEKPNLIIDTHGADIIDPVYDLLEIAYKKFGALPTLLERDFNIPPLNDLLTEVDQIHKIQRPFLKNTLIGEHNEKAK